MTKIIAKPVEVENKTREIMDKDPFDHILPHIISVGNKLESQSPIGSGTLIKFTASICGISIKVYGILSAAHVVEELEAEQNGCIYLAKPKDRSGVVYAEKRSIEGIYYKMDNRYYRMLTQGHNNLKCRNERDIAFICLGIGNFGPESELMYHSDFFDLDNNQKLEFSRYHTEPLVFFKGACLDELTHDGILETGIIIEYGSTIKKYPRSQIHYHQIPNTRAINRPLDGTSGAGVWAFYRDDNDNITKSLIAIVVEGDKNYTNAIDLSYVTEVLCPSIERDINNSLMTHTIACF